MMGNSIDHGMFRNSVLLAFGLSISFSGFALAALEKPVPGQQVQAVEGARKINPAAVEVLLDNNRRMTLDFTGITFSVFSEMTKAVLSATQGGTGSPHSGGQSPEAGFPAGCGPEGGCGCHHYGEGQD